jgi:radical SAM superfamily enzyme YgiQ (UPF0313 family)
MTGSQPLRVLDSSAILKRDRNTTRPVILVGFQNQGNLGIGYLAATLRQHGYRVRVFDFETDPEEILAAAKSLRPITMGFSLIFQFYIHRFRALMNLLRKNGIDCHFTMGGHFPSLSYQQTLDLVPELDSVARFEGELTLLELVDCLGREEEWRRIDGLAYRRGEAFISNPLRKLVDDLDQFPHPDRDFKPMMTLGHPIIPLLASRGCARTCSFCSIQTFYRAAPGKIVRTRNPRKVVEEMDELYKERGATIFLFQDDDFPLFGPVWRRWAGEFVNELHRSGLPGHVIWKMNCRADAVDRELFISLRDAGLYFVYMGLESGNEEGLRTLHKQITVEQNLQAVETLKSIGLVFEYGFMLFDPSSTFESVRANLAFLRQIVGDGSTAATFCRMLPYDGTSIKDDLEKTGRLRGDVCNPDYDFLDPLLNEFYEGLTQYLNVSGWIHGYEALSIQLKWAWHEVAVMEKLFPQIAEMPEHKAALRRISAESNEFLIRIVEDLSWNYSDGRPCRWQPGEVETRRLQFLEALLAERNGFVARNESLLLSGVPA